MSEWRHLGRGDIRDIIVNSEASRASGRAGEPHQGWKVQKATGPAWKRPPADLEVPCSCSLHWGGLVGSSIQQGRQKACLELSSLGSS